MENTIKELLKVSQQNQELIGIVDQFITLTNQLNELVEKAKKALEKPSNP